MRRLLPRRWVRSRSLRVLGLITLIVLLDVVSLSSSLSKQRLNRVRLGSQPVPAERVFIASTHWNNEAILRSHWNQAILDLSSALGPDRVHVSIVESGSWDDSKGALRDLDRQLGVMKVPRSIVLNSTTHADEIAQPPAAHGWINTPTGQRALRRIPYLARLRNLSLDPLLKLAEQHQRFDKILFLNDVVFETEDVLNLLRTNSGVYAAACALDFSHPPLYYDTFALRDAGGLPSVTQIFPYFASPRSRRAMRDGEAVPVQSCWNGMVLFDAAPFYSDGKSLGDSEAQSLRFRGVSDSLATFHLEASECCLVHYDNPLTLLKGVYLNPHVRVAYGGSAYRTIHEEPWPSFPASYWGIWWNRFVRGIRSMSSALARRKVRAAVRRWQDEGTGDGSVKRHERGGSCLIDEMQILASNGWAHV